MKQVLIRKGKIIVDNIPAPVVGDNSVLVKVRYSLISAGTEMASVASTKESVIQKALKQPENVKKTLDLAKNKGISHTISRVKSQLNASRPAGYSCSGIVAGVGERVQNIKVGDRVACAGYGEANHAEVVCVPDNLVVKVPENLDLEDAASVTLGAIAMQGVRRADPGFGEIVAVIGLGLIGQITVQLLKAAGCYVLGVEISKSRIELAKSLGMDYGILSEEDPVAGAVRYTSGYGADITIITASTKSDKPVDQAMKMTRKKGKVVLVGDVGLHLMREPFYERELDFLISTSYGPGRYDEVYEEKGLDYPYPYVRWTENRNMGEYLKMLAGGKVNFKALVSKIYPVEEAEKAYLELQGGENNLPALLLKYDEDCGTKIVQTKVPLRREGEVRGPKPGIVKLGVIGAGSFAKAVHLPNLKKLSNLYEIHALVGKTGHSVKETAQRFGAKYCSTDYTEVINDEDVDAVLIATRHNLHARIVLEALKAAKHVFVEKPLCIEKDELLEIVNTYNTSNAELRIQPVLMVGFNRRFSPYVKEIKEKITNRINPMIINYRMNAGYIPTDHWVHTEEGGGRNIGEACHIYDLFNFFTDAEVTSIEASSIAPKTEQYGCNDNFVATIEYKDGSVCTLTYTALGSEDYPKETMDIYVDNTIFHLTDYKRLRVFGNKSNKIKTKGYDKGHFETIKAFHTAIQNGQEGVPFWQMVQATEIALRIESQLSGGC
jgi:predicted dehydrogenase/threonine dehydrogenase-like Zn-dependent dehydrogenase